MHENHENWKTSGFFVIFGVNLKHFHLENYNKLFGKAYWITHSFFVDPFQRTNPQRMSKIRKKCIKSLKTRKFFDFCHLWCQFETFSLRKLLLSVNKRQLDN